MKDTLTLTDQKEQQKEPPPSPNRKVDERRRPRRREKEMSLDDSLVGEKKRERTKLKEARIKSESNRLAPRRALNAEMREKEQELLEKERELRELELNLEIQRRQVEMEKLRKQREDLRKKEEHRLREKKISRAKDKEWRLLGEKPSYRDLMIARFSLGHKFGPDEIVLVPRTRGGFTYGKITKACVRNHCYIDPSVKGVRFREWRVVYPNPKGGMLFKDMAGALVGKISKANAANGKETNKVILKKRDVNAPPVEHVACSLTRQVSEGDHGSLETSGTTHDNSAEEIKHDAAEDDSFDFQDEIEDDLEGETIMFKGIVPQTGNSDKYQNAGSPDEKDTMEAVSPRDELLARDEAQPHQEESSQRSVGSKATPNDLNIVSFSQQNSFHPNEVVIIPRSAGGFTYGRVLGQQEMICPLGAGSALQHSHSGWRVLVAINDSSHAKPRVTKDVFTLHLGKLHLPGLCPNPVMPSTPSITESISSPRFQNSVSPREMNQEATVLNSSDQLDPYQFKEVDADDKRHYNFEEPDLGFVPYITPEPVVPQSAPRSASPRSPRAELNHVEDDVDHFRDYENECEEDVNHEQKNQLPVPSFSGMFSSAPKNGTTKAPVVVSLPTTIKPTASDTMNSTDQKKESRGGLLSVPAGAIPNGTHETGDKKHRNRNKVRRSPSAPSGKQQKCMIVLDGPNVAMKHGKQKVFSISGLKIAIEYWEKRGHEVVAFMPQHFATRKAPAGQELRLMEFMPMADNVPLLQKLVEQGRVVLTPSQDYDDSYSIEYAKRHGACIVTNDRYWDHVDKQPEAQRGRIRHWIRDHCISFTFVRNEFLPNPDFVFPQNASKDE